MTMCQPMVMTFACPLPRRTHEHAGVEKSSYLVDGKIVLFISRRDSR